MTAVDVPNLTLGRLHLGGCTKILRGDKPDITLAVIALMNCEEHYGSHHFFVTNEGTYLGCSAIAVECLTAQGISV